MIFYPWEGETRVGLQGIYFYGTYDMMVLDGIDYYRKGETIDRLDKYEGYSCLFDGMNSRYYSQALGKDIESWTQFKSEKSKTPWFVVKFPEAVIMKGEKLRTSYHDTSVYDQYQNPTEWKVYGSDSYDPEHPNDGWTEINYYRDPNLNGRLYEYEYTFSNNNTRGYQYYKVVFTNNRYYYEDYISFCEYKFRWEECEHNYVTTTEAPKCTEDTHIINKCTKCNAVKSDTVVKAKGHNLEYFEQRAVSYEQDGIKYSNYHCSSYCGKNYSDEEATKVIGEGTDFIIPKLEIKFTVIDGLEKTGNLSENYDKLFDGKKTTTGGTKYCIEIKEEFDILGTFQYNVPYITLEADHECVLESYVFYTANDTAKYPWRNPNAWIIYGSNDYNPTTKEGNWYWADIKIPDEAPLGATNYTPYTFNIDSIGLKKPYKYFRIVIYENQEKRYTFDKPLDEHLMQLAEIELNVKACVHDFTEWIPEVPATCEATGTKGHYLCKNCNYHFDANYVPINNSTIKALGHDWQAPKYELTNSYTQMKATRKCSHDESHIETETVDVTKVVTIPRNEVCQDDEYGNVTGVFNNPAFGSYTMENVKTGDPLDHSWDVNELYCMYRESNDTILMVAKGIHCNTCTFVHPDIQYEECSVTVVQHQSCLNDEIVNCVATFTLLGEKTIDGFKSKDKLGHKYGNVSYELIDNNFQMKASHSCTNPGCNHVEKETKPITSQKIQDQSCTKDELYEYKAQFTNTTFGTHTIEVVMAKKLGHDYGDVKYELINNNTKMKATRVCKNDTKHIETETVATSKTVTQNRTCELDEISKFTGEFNNSAFGIHVIENITTATKLGHKYNDENVIYELLENNTQMKASNTCINPGCNYVLSETTNATSVIFIYQTCENDEITIYSARFYDLPSVDLKIKTKDKLGHDYGDVKYELINNNTEMKATRVCKNNSEHIETQNALVTAQITQSCTCETDELTTFTGQFINSVFGTHVIKDVITATKLGHDYGDVKYELTENNTEMRATRVCKNNSEHVETETVTATRVITQDKSCTQDELSKFTGIFSNTAFGTHEMPNIKTADKAHTFDRPTYVWSKDNTTVEASHTCKIDGFIETETVNVLVTVTQQKTCLLNELSKYSATFTKKGFNTQVKTNVITASKLGHNTSASTYVWIDPVASTCSTKGKIGHYECSLCDHYFDEDHNLIYNINLPLAPHTFDDEKDPTCNNCTYKRIVIDYSGYSLDSKIKDFTPTVISGISGISLKEGASYENGYWISDIWNLEDFYGFISSADYSYFLSNQEYLVILNLDVESGVNKSNIKMTDISIAGLGGNVISIDKDYANCIEVVFTLPLLGGNNNLLDVPSLKYSSIGIELDNRINNLSFMGDTSNLVNPEMYFIVYRGGYDYLGSDTTTFVYDKEAIVFLDLVLFAPNGYTFKNYTKTNFEVDGLGNPDYMYITESGSVLTAEYIINFRETACSHPQINYEYNEIDNHAGYCTTCQIWVTGAHEYDNDLDSYCNLCNAERYNRLEKIEFDISGYTDGGLISDFNIKLSSDTNQTIQFNIEKMTHTKDYNSPAITNFAMAHKFISSRDYYLTMQLTIPFNFDTENFTSDMITAKNMDIEVTLLTIYNIDSDGEIFYLQIKLPKLINTSNPITNVEELNFDFNGFEKGNTIDDLTLTLDESCTGVTYDYDVTNRGRLIGSDHNFSSEKTYLLEIIVKASIGYDLYHLDYNNVTVSNTYQLADYYYNISNEELLLYYLIVIEDEAHIHEYNEIVVNDANYHFAICECGAITDKELHQYDNNSTRCNVCNYMKEKVITTVNVSILDYVYGKETNKLTIVSSTLGIAEFISNSAALSAYESAKSYDLLSLVYHRDETIKANKKYYLMLSISCEKDYTFDFDNLDPNNFNLEGVGKALSVTRLITSLSPSVIALFEMPIVEAPHIHGGELIDEVPATCVETGVKEHFVCTICGKNCDKNNQVIEDLTIPAKGHSFGEAHYVWANDNTTVTGTHVCTIDGVVETKTVNVVVTISQQKTCVLNELSNFTATFTKQGFKTQTRTNILTASKTGHNLGDTNYQWVEEVLPTCTKAGSIAHYYCSVCQSHYDENHHLIANVEIPKISHTFDDDLDAKCNVCDYQRIIIDYSGYEVNGCVQNFNVSLPDGVEGVSLTSLGTSKNFMIFDSWDLEGSYSFINVPGNVYFQPNQEYSCLLVLLIDEGFDASNLSSLDFYIAGIGSHLLYCDINANFSYIELAFNLPLLGGEKVLADAPNLSYSVSGIEVGNVINQLTFTPATSNLINATVDFKISVGGNEYEANEHPTDVYDNKTVYYLHLSLYAPKGYIFKNYTKNNIYLEGFGNPLEIEFLEFGFGVTALYRVTLRETECTHTFDYFTNSDSKYHRGYCKECKELVEYLHVYDSDSDTQCKECNFPRYIELNELEFDISGYVEGGDVKNLKIEFSEGTNSTFLSNLFNLSHTSEFSNETVPNTAKFMHTRDYYALLFLGLPSNVELYNFNENSISFNGCEAEVDYLALYTISDSFLVYVLQIKLPRLVNNESQIKNVEELDFTLDGLEEGNTLSDITLALSEDCVGVTFEYNFYTDTGKVNNSHIFSYKNIYELELKIKAQAGYELYYINQDLINVTNTDSYLESYYDLEKEEYVIYYNVFVSNPGHTHSFNEKYVYNNDYHFTICECGKKNGTESHEYDEDSFECNICGYKKKKVIYQLDLSLSGYEVGRRFDSISVSSNTIGIAEIRCNISPFVSAINMDFSSLPQQDFYLF